MDSAAVRYSAKRAVEYKRFIDACSVLVRSTYCKRQLACAPQGARSEIQSFIARCASILHAARVKRKYGFIDRARVRSSNKKLKFYCNAKRIAHFKINPCIFILCTMTNTYILTQALEALHALQVFHVLVYIDLLHAFQALESLEYACVY